MIAAGGGRGRGSVPARREPCGFPRALAAALLLLGAASGGALAQGGAAALSPVHLVPVVLPTPSGGQRMLAFIAELPTPALVSGSKIQGGLHLRILDAQGTEIRSADEPFALPAVGDDGQAVEGVKLFGEVPLDPGRYTLEASLLDGSKTVVGSSRTTVQVPAADVRAWVASTPLVADARTGWRAYRANSLAASGLAFPFTLSDGSRFVPRGEPALAPGADDELLVLVASANGDLPDFDGELEPAGGPAVEVPVSLDSVTPSAVPGVLLARVRVTLPNLAGAARLRIRLAAGNRALPEALPDGLACDLEVGAATTAAGAPGAPAPDQAAIAAGYLDVLHALAERGALAAAPELVAFERDTTAPDPSGRLHLLREAEERVARRVAGRDTDAWTAILWLHVEADGGYLDARETWLTAQGRRYIGQIVRSGRFARRPETRRLAADALALVAPADALELDPGQPLALLRLAIHEERAFRPAAAVDLLRRLVAATPADGQAHLRLGVNLRRLGSIGEAVRELTSASAEGAPVWVREMAYGELAAIAREQGQHDRAEMLLRDGIDKVGGEQLYLQLAFYLEQRDRSREAVQWVNKMPVEEGQERPSARHVYAQDPEREMAAVRDRLRTAAAKARTRLAELLATSTPEVGR